MAKVDITKVDARARAPARREPYWHRIQAGCYLGFRKMTADSHGAWVARYRDEETGKQQHTALGEWSELPPSERFDAASKKGREWFKHLDKGGNNEAKTVGQACAEYVQQLEGSGRSKAANDAKSRFGRWINGTSFGAIELQKLKASTVAAWRTKLANTLAIPQNKRDAPSRPRSASTLNRDMTTVRAALNLALENKDVTDDAAWKDKLKPVKNADGRRDVYLDRPQRIALIGAAAEDLAKFLRALSMVPLRPGAMAARVAGDFDARLSTLTIGKDKGGADRKITLPKDTAAFFAAQAQGKKAGDPLLARADGAAWNKDSWKYPVKNAVVVAGLPEKTCAYALRHSTITDLIALHKLDTLTVAQLSGTSLQMIEKHYGHLLRDHAAAALAHLSI